MKKIITVMALILLAACGDATVISTRPIQIDVARTADPEPVRMLPVQFRVVTAESLDSFISELRASQGNNNPVFIAVSTRDYENMALNLADLRRYIEQQRAIVVYYREITRTNTPRPQ